MIQRDSFHIPTDLLSDFCSKHHILTLSLFGSVVRDDFRADSDIDVLVEFMPDHIPGLSFFSMQSELTVLFNRTVDLNTIQDISPYFRDAVIKERRVIYDAAG